MRQHLGLGTATVIDRIHIRWPSGMIEETTLVAVDQRLTLVEGTLPAAVDDAPEITAVRLTAAPNPTAGAVRLAYTLPSPSRVSLRILDLQGRLVRSIERGAERDAARHEAVWDGADAGGRRVAPGVYVADLTSAAGSRRVRLVRY